MKNLLQAAFPLLALCLMNFAHALDNADHSFSAKFSPNPSGVSQIVKHKLDSTAQPQPDENTEEEEE